MKKLNCLLLILFTFFININSYTINNLSAEIIEIIKEKWQYKIVQFGERESLSNQQLETFLNKLGKEGWELIYANFLGTIIFIFKRKI